MSILITGGKGQLGSEVAKLLLEKGIDFVSTDSEQLDILNSEQIELIFQKVNPDYVIHCAAYTAVDKAEDEGKELNYQVNVEGTKNIAYASEKFGATLIYISTDYVFDGESLDDYKEDSLTNPMNEYGKAKLEGERVVQEICSKAFIVRTSWVFGEFGNNFVKTMIRLSQTNEQIKVVNDQYGRPTWTRTLAEFIYYLLSTDQDYGIYHLSNDGVCSWYEFAKYILAKYPVTVLPISSDEYPQKAYRPRKSVMDLSKTKSIGFQIPTWQEALNCLFESGIL